MRSIHPAAWVGLILNCGLVYFLYAMLQSANPGELTEQETAIVNLLLAARPLIFSVLLVQAVSLGLIAMRLTIGVVLGCAAGGLLLPAGFVFIIGCVLSHYMAKYYRFPLAPRGFAGARGVFRSGQTPRLRLFCSVTGVIALLLILIGMGDVGSLALGLALTGIFFAARANTQHPLALFDGYFTLSPEFMAPRLLIRYDQVREASLSADESIRFAVETEQGPAEISWSLRGLRQQDRQRAVDELGMELSAHGARLA